MAMKLTTVYTAGLINYASLISLKVIRFHSYIIKLCKELPTTCYWKYGQNATDQQFASEPNNQHYTAEKIVTRGNEKNHSTVLLACAGDGSKLRSMVIFKRKTVPKVENKHRVISATHEKGRMKGLACSMWWTLETKTPAYLCFRSSCD